MYKCKICDDVKPKKTVETIFANDIIELERLEKKQRGAEQVHPRGDSDYRKKSYELRHKSYNYKPGSQWTTSVTYDPYKSKVTLSAVSDKEKIGLRSEAFNILVTALNLLVKKHEDYGPKNISEAPGGALQGLLVRLHDKMARLKNLTENNKKPNHESIEDTFIDIINYATIALLVIKDKWDK